MAYKWSSYRRKFFKNINPSVINLKSYYKAWTSLSWSWADIYKNLFCMWARLRPFLQCIQWVKITWPRLKEMYAIEMCVPLSVSGTHNIQRGSPFPAQYIVTHPSASQSVSQSVSLSHFEPWVSSTVMLLLLSKKAIKLRAIIRK